MSALNNIAGPWSAVFVGTYSGSSVLQRISNQRTEGSAPDFLTPTEYVTSTNNYEISGPTTWSFDLTFYTDTDIPLKLCRRLDLATININGPPDIEMKYVLLCTKPSGQISFLFKEIQTEIDYNPNYNKDKPTQLTVKFKFSNLDPNYDGYEWGSIGDLSVALGSRSPIT